MPDDSHMTDRLVTPDPWGARGIESDAHDEGDEPSAEERERRRKADEGHSESAPAGNVEGTGGPTPRPDEGSGTFPAGNVAGEGGTAGDDA